MTGPPHLLVLLIAVVVVFALFYAMFLVRPDDRDEPDDHEVTVRCGICGRTYRVNVNHIGAGQVLHDEVFCSATHTHKKETT